ncbi:MAG: hypothetical protein WDM92_07655 [Caulobacteraceae bacterium]
MGLAVAAAGAGVIVLLWLQVMDQSGGALFVERIGIPGVLLLTVAATLSLVFGLHLLAAPGSAVRRWTPDQHRRT